MENLTKEELMDIARNVSLEKDERKKAARILIDKYPETKDVKVCKDCGRFESEIKRSYVGLSGDMYFYRDTCPCGRSNTAPEEYDTDVCMTFAAIAWLL